MSQPEPPSAPLPWLDRVLASNLIFGAAALALVAGTLAAAQSQVPHPDLAYYLYAASRLLDGARLYRDIIEINPPLIIWLNVPAVVFGRFFGIADLLAYRLLVSLAVGGLALLTARLADRAAPGLNARRSCVLALAFALFPLAGADFGQREHLVLALLLPYLALTAGRIQPVQPSRRQALFVGVLAGAGLCLKPHFLLAWLAVEAFRRTRPGADRWGVTPELVGVAACIAGYVGAVAFVTPDYFRIVVVLGPAYTSFMRRSPLDVTLLAPAAPLVLLALLAFAAHRESLARTAIWPVAAVAAFGCYASAAVQQKGFTYHYYPAVTLGLMLLVGVATARPHPGSPVARSYLFLARAVVITTVLMTGGGALLHATRPDRSEARALSTLAAVVRTRAHDRPVAVLSYTINSAFPLMNEAGTTLAFRLPCLWPLATSYWDSLSTGGLLRYHSPSGMSAAERLVWDGVRDDLLASRPAVLVILRPGRDVARNGLRRLNYVAYFERQPGLAEFFADYELVDIQGEYLVYERLAANATRLGPSPTSDPGNLEAPLAPQSGLGLALLDDASRVRLGLFAAALAIVAVSGIRRRSAPGDTGAADPT
jgi:hypothetical protein